MELELEIHQKKFSSEQQKALLNIIFTASFLHAEQNRTLKPYQISTQQYNVLRILRGQKGNPASIALIQERMLDKQSNASRLIDKLEAKKLVNRIQCPADKRRAEITISETGLSILLELDDKIKNLEKNIPLNELEAKELNQMLNKVRNKPLN
jgi:DNA-binding MarR family transcriptional regulator